MKIIQGTIIAAFLAATFTLTPGTALAKKTCADRIKDAQSRLDMSARPVASIEGRIQDAKEALENGKKKKCGKKVKLAEKLLDKKGL